MRALGWMAGVVACALAACGGSGDGTVMCDDGRMCLAGQVCDDVHAICVDPAQLTACDGLAEGAACAFGNAIGHCRDGVCLRQLCGDGFVDSPEQCDGNDLGGATDCTDLGYYDPGTLACHPDCTFDTSACSGLCGDAVKNGPESCDSTDFGGATCADFGFYTGTLGCSVACDSVSTAQCSGFCGDNTVNGTEMCDGQDLNGHTCQEYGFSMGSLACDVSCAIDISGCHN